MFNWFREKWQFIIQLGHVHLKEREDLRKIIFLTFFDFGCAEMWSVVRIYKIWHGTNYDWPHGNQVSQSEPKIFEIKRLKWN